MTESKLSQPSGNTSDPAFRRESPRSRGAALKALSCDGEQLWQRLADRFGEAQRNGTARMSRLQDGPVISININRGRKDGTDRQADARVHGCGYVRHA